MTRRSDEAREKADVDRVLRAAMLAASWRFEAPPGSALRKALEQLTEALDRWAEPVQPRAGVTRRAPG
jgi:hypothetical protein